MCGILGIVGNPRSESLDAVELLRHRGPDGEGRWLGPNAGLAMRRLAIIDLETGDQPVSNERGDVVAVVNGELYNYRELRADLVAKGHTFRGVGDVELVPHLYEEYGDRFVEHLRGMFAIALWDDSRDRLVLARDRFGIKPLYLADVSEGLAFSSELAPLLALGASSEPDLEAIADYLVLGYVPGNADGHPRRAEAGARRAARARRRADARGAVVAPGAARAPARGDARGSGAAAPALRRPARGAPLRRPRLVADRVACGARARPAAAHVHGRFRRRRVRRARAGARDRPRDRVAARGADGRDRRRGGSAGDRGTARAAARRPRRDPALVPLPRRRVRGEGRARRRRRRRGLRRLLALRVGPGRRPPWSARPARAAAPGARRPQERRAPRVEAAQARVEARGVPLPLVVRADGRRRARARLRAAVRRRRPAA